MNTFTINAIGYFSTLCICVNQIPQIWLTVKTRNVADLSLKSSLVYVAGNAAGLVFGLGMQMGPVIITSIITLATSVIMTALILRYGRRRPRATTRWRVLDGR